MVDALCYDDLDPNGTELDDPEAEFEQDCYHRIREAPGSNIDDEDRGLGADRMLSGPLDTSLADLAEAEIRKDDRATGVKASMTVLDAGGNAGATVQLDIEVEGIKFSVTIGGGS